MKRQDSMSSPPRPKSNEEFLDSLLFPDLQSQYGEDYKQAVRKVRSEFKKEEAQVVERIERGLSDDDEHRRALNACIYPFARGQVQGYYFVCAGPLSELGIKNLDFLIVCGDPPDGETKIAMFGESKGPMTDPDPVVTQAKDRIKTLAQNWDYVFRQYLGNMTSEREFIIGVFASDANELAKSVIRKGGGIIVWSIDLSNDPILCLHRPEVDREDRELRQSMMHRNQTLNQLLSRKITTSPSFKTFYVQSHMMAKLRILTGVDKGTGQGTFTPDDVKSLVREALDYESDEVVERETSAVLAQAQSIRFIRDVGAGKLKIRSRSKIAGVREREIKQLWIRWKLDEELRERVDSSVVELQQSYEAKKQAIPTLEPYVKQNEHESE